jgi:hypothetical protein
MSGRRWVWTKEPIMFHNNADKEWITIPAWTKGYLVKPNEEERQKISRYQEIDQMRVFLVHLEGMNRYIGINKLMTEDAWNERRDRLRQSGILPEDG